MVATDETCRVIAAARACNWIPAPREPDSGSRNTFVVGADSNRAVSVGRMQMISSWLAPVPNVAEIASSRNVGNPMMPPMGDGVTHRCPGGSD